MDVSALETEVIIVLLQYLYYCYRSQWEKKVADL